MGNTLRGLFFIGVFALYASMVYFKGIGDSSYGMLAFMFALNVYFFIPIKMASRSDYDDGNFFEIIGEGESQEKIDRILIIIGLLTLSTIGSAFMSSQGSDMGIIGLVVGGIVIVGLFVVFKRLIALWYEMNMTSIEVYVEGNIFDKGGMLISYIGMITFMTVAGLRCTDCEMVGIIFTSAMYVFFFSPALPMLLTSMFQNNRFFSVDLPSGNDVSFALALGIYLFTLAVQIPAVNFSVSIAPEVIQLFSILVSIPGMFVLSTIIASIIIREKRVNYLVTLGVIGTFYGTVFFQSTVI